MSVFDYDKVKLKALEYAEKNKIVNAKTINAFIDGFKLRDAKSSDEVLSYLEKQFEYNSDSAESDIGYGDMRGESASNRKKEGYDAQEIATKIKELHKEITDFNKKYNINY